MLLSGNRFRPDTPVAWELYDLKNDPHEKVNIYEELRGSKEVQKLKAMLMKVRAEIGDTDQEYPHIDKIVQSNW